MLSSIKLQYKGIIKRQAELSGSTLVTKGLVSSSVLNLWKEGFKGKGIKIAVLDSGINEHLDLQNAVVEKHNLVSERPQESQESQEAQEAQRAHGTHVAGIIAARGLFTGIAPESELVDIKIINNNGTSVNLLLKALELAIRSKVNIVNISLGGSSLSDFEISSLSQAVRKAWDNGIVCLAASGNDGTEICNTEPYNFPAAIPRVESIGSVKIPSQKLDYALSSFSNENDKLTLVTQGEDVISLAGKEDYAIMSGTSMATPHASGFLALLYQKLLAEYPDLHGSRLSSLVTSLLHQNTLETKDGCLKAKYINKSYGLGFLRYQPEKKVDLSNLKPYYYSGIFLGYIL
jgi:major intracellular serine protease